MALCARDIMQVEVLSVAPTMTLDDLEDFLLKERIGGVPVIEHGALVGVVSRSDFVRAAGLERSLAGAADAAAEELGAAPNAKSAPGGARVVHAHTVRDIMAPDVLTVAPETPLDEVARLLAKRHLHRVLVTEGAMVRGVISTLDIVRLVADHRLREATD